MTKNKLVYWNMGFLKQAQKWIEKEHPLFLQEWEMLLKADLALSRRAGYATSSQSTLDRAEEFETVFHTQPLIPWIPFKEYPREDFDDCMYKSAQLIADKGKTIDFFWSGGLDSNAALLAFNELGLHKQLHVIMGGKLETPEMFEKVVKGRMDYTWEQTSSAEAFYGIAKLDEHLLCTCSEFDVMFGGKGNFAARGTKVKNPDSWEVKRRYYTARHGWGMSLNFKGDWVDINNYMPFVMQPPLEKWLCNFVLDDKMLYHDVSDDSWENKEGTWRTTGDAPNTPGQEWYKQVKMPLRDFLYKLTKDEYLCYHKPKLASMLRLRGRRAGRKDQAKSRILAITNGGDVVDINNFYDFDWPSYIVNF